MNFKILIFLSLFLLFGAFLCLAKNSQKESPFKNKVIELITAFFDLLIKLFQLIQEFFNLIIKFLLFLKKKISEI